MYKREMTIKRERIVRKVIKSEKKQRVQEKNMN
jgi:hypothetical protein